ncbi:MAG: hypothetical protein HY869_13810 [Chloroflexi bacterium]|nr:hypothetical protein [Chloroflexota bacterium]
MTSRSIFSGFLTGLLTCLPLWLIMHDGWSERLERGALTSSALEIVAWLSILFFIPLGGFLSAKWNWAGTRAQSARTGAVAGLVTGMLAYVLVGAAGMGVMGNLDMLNLPENYVASQQTGANHVYQALISTAYWVYLGFWGFLLAGSALGAAGGWMAGAGQGWGKAPVPKEEWLLRLPFYLLLFSGCFHYALTAAFFGAFSESLYNSNALTFLPADLLTSAGDILFLSLTTSLLTLLLPQAACLGWMLAAWKYRRFRGYYLFGLLAAVISLAVTLRSIDFDLGRYFVGALGFCLLTAFTWGVARETERPSEPARHSFGDWIVFLLWQGLLSGAQAFVGLIPFALSASLLTVGNMSTLLDQGGVVDSIPTQLNNVFSILLSAGLILMTLGGLGGLFTAWIVAFVRKFFFYPEFFNRAGLDTEWNHPSREISEQVP